MFDTTYLSVIGRVFLNRRPSRHAAIHDRDGHDLDDDLVLSGRGRGRVGRFPVALAGIPSASGSLALERSADVPVPPRTFKKVMHQ
jgi:hypothetical protein